LEPGRPFLNSRNVWELDLVEIVTEGRGSIWGRFVEVDDVEYCLTLVCLLVGVIYNCVGSGLLVDVEYN
jgi:hypothetical protein